MTRLETLNHVADELRSNVSNRFELALLTMVETFADITVEDEDLTWCWSFGNIGLNVTRDKVELVDIDAGRAIISLELKFGTQEEALNKG